MNEDKSSRYHRLRRRARVAAVALTVLFLALLLLTGASAAAAASIRAALPRPSLAVAVYALALAALQEALAFPLVCYRSFVLDRRYGLSSEPFASWLRDHAVASVLGTVLALAGAEVVYLCLRWSPAWWWLPAAAAFSAAAAVMAKLAPVLLMPLFYTIRPMSRAPLGDRLAALSARAGVPVLGVYEWGLGGRSARANAALVGTGRTRRILVSDTMLAAYSEEEIEVVVAHEIAHHVHGDIRAALVLEAGLLGAALLAAALALRVGWTAAGLASPADVGGLPLILLAAGAVLGGATPLVNAVSRRNERRADSYALALTGQPAAFISAMRRLATQNLAEEDPPRAVLWLFHTHPSIAERIERARAFTPRAAAGGSGVSGR
ncbi:MAG: M48 family metalloprotease [Acidobacteriota bacterium]